MPLFSSYDNNTHKQAIMNRRDILKSILGFGIGIGSMPLSLKLRACKPGV